MRHICKPNEMTEALDVLQDYYKYDLLDQMRSLAESSTEHLYPFMCRQYLPIQYHLKVNSLSSTIDLVFSKGWFFCSTSLNQK